MNAVVAAAAAGRGGLAITAEVADERVCAVRISSTRPTNLSRLFIGRPAQEAPLLAERIFSLCGVSHRIVAARAIASARQEPVCPSRDREQAIALVADGLSAALRANMILALDGDADRSDLDHIRAVGELLSLLRDLCSEIQGRSAEGGDNRKKPKAVIRNIRALGRDLYARGPQSGAGPASRFPFERLEREFIDGDSFTVAPPDALGDTDDWEVMQRMRTEDASFAALPSLQGRAPETGAFARRWAQTDFSKGALAARLEARMIDITACFAELERAERDPPAPRAVSPSPREGFATAETSRGRLYHWVRLAADGRIEDYRIVAPTEWNFHPTGPFVEALLGAAVRRGRAERRIARLAGLFDPCVPFRLEVKEHRHA
jgi:coenzyme F420-reducing hydrogenase alpha subunit